MTLTIVSALLVLFVTSASAFGADRINPRREAVVDRLDRGLAGTPMSGTGRQLEAAGFKHGVNPAFIAAVAGVESTYGAAPCRQNRRNVWGLSSCGTGWHVPYFGTWAGAYDFFARFVRRQWPSARSPWDFHGYCVDRYGNDCPTWPGKVASNMRRLGSGQQVRYP